MENLKDKIININQTFLSSCQKLLKIDWKKVIEPLILEMSFEFAREKLMIFFNDFQFFLQIAPLFTCSRI
ncbi:MAG: hypothetical protein K9W44_09590 [Candidatus Lokiarchaeota archaeon]|nr:hypothetical protein [Candidatus Harpocratesius repetitus]